MHKNTSKNRSFVERANVIDIFQSIMGMIRSSIGEVFILIIFFKSATANVVVIDAMYGTLTTIFFKTFTEISGYFYGAIGVVSCVLIGIIVSTLSNDRKIRVSDITIEI